MDTDDLKQSLEPARWLTPVRRRVLLVFGGLVVAAGVVAGLTRERWLGAYHDFQAQRYVGKARAFQAAGDPASGRLMIQNAIRHRNDLPEAWVVFSDLAPTENPATRLGALLYAVQYNPERADLARTFLSECVKYRAQALVTNLAGFVDRYPHDAMVSYYAGLIEAQQGRNNAAHSYLSRAQALSPLNDQIAFSLAVMDIQSTNTAWVARGLDLLTRLGEGSPLERAALDQLGNYWSTRNLTNAVTAWSRLSVLEPNNWTVRIKRLDALRQVAPQKSADELSVLHHLASQAQEHLDVLTRAAAWFGTGYAMEWLKDLPLVLREKADFGLLELEFLASRQAWGEVVKVATQHTRLHDMPNEVLPFWLWLARAQLMLKEEATARYAIRTALNVIQYDPVQAVQCADLLDAWGSTDLSVEFYQEAAREVTPFQAMALRKLLALHERRHDPESALAVVRRLQTAAPDWREGLASLEAALLMVTGGDIRRALALSKEQFDRTPSNPRVAANYARALLLSGKAEDALKLYARLAPETYQDPVARMYYAECLRQNGRAEEARDLVRIIPASVLYPRDATVLQGIVAGSTP